MEMLFKLADALSEEKSDIPAGVNQELLLGQIMINRIVSIAYDAVNHDTLHPEALKMLRIIKDRNVEIYNQFMNNLEFLTDILKPADFNYAFLKGAYLAPFLYKAGHRTSNDIDILISSENVSKLQRLLLSNNFIQGHIVSGKIVPASRKEIIESKMNFGETVPFIRQMEDNVLEVDINFSLDFKPSQDKQIVSNMISRTILVEKDQIRFRTLSLDDFLIHLCCHLYKEATTYDWLQTRRDLLLYKFSDINVYIHKHGGADFFSGLVSRIKQLGLEKECYYTFENASIIYPHMNKFDSFIETKESIMPSSLDFMTQILWPRERKLLQHNMSFIDWFYCSDRVGQLEAIKHEAY